MIKKSRIIRNKKYFKDYEIMVLRNGRLYEFYCKKDDSPYDFIYAEEAQRSWRCLNYNYINCYESLQLFSYVTEGYERINQL